MFVDADDVAAIGRLERMARGQVRRYPRTQNHFLPNARARIVILATSRSRWARQQTASLVSGRLGGWLGFTESFALDMNRVR